MKYLVLILMTLTTALMVGCTGPRGVLPGAPGNSVTATPTYTYTTSPVATATYTPTSSVIMVTTLAGSGTNGDVNGTGTAASFGAPQGVAVDASGNVYVGDLWNQSIRKITPAGVVSTLAGLGTGPGVSNNFMNGSTSVATFNGPSEVAVDNSGNVYVSEWANSTIRKISGGMVSTLAGTVQTRGFANGTPGIFNNNYQLAADNAGNIYVADSNNDLIRKITPAGVVSTLAGTVGVTGQTNGTGTGATFNTPCGLAVDNSGNVYVGDLGTNLIRKITPGGVVTTLAGSGTGSTNGTGTAASFNGPWGLAVDNQGNVYVADLYNNLIRKISPAGVVSTLAGTGATGFNNGLGSVATFNQPMCVAVDNTGNVYVADTGNNAIRKITQ